MAACEKCWEEATWRCSERGGLVAEHYIEVLRERGGEKACTPKEQCGELHIIPTGMKSCRCGRKND